MSKYSNLEKILHQQFLGSNPLSDYLYKRILKKASSKKTDIKKIRHLFISGLARSGTTAILNQIYESDDFVSLLYKHMPFILSPKLAKTISLLVNDISEGEERLHNDGLIINNQSPECLDEIFWIKSNPNYFLEEMIEPKKIDVDLLDGYNYFLSCYSAIQGNKRLVIKNNNNHIRLKFLYNYFDYCDFFVIFRNPIAQAYSLLNTHLRFCKLQMEDNYILEYMNLVGHREFGKGIKRFIYNDIADKNKYREDTINYWLVQWINCYEWILLNKFHKKNNINLICYENICQNEAYLKKIHSILNINFAKNKLINKNKTLSQNKKNLLSIDPLLERKSLEIYEELKKLG